MFLINYWFLLEAGVEKDEYTTFLCKRLDLKIFYFQDFGSAIS